MRGRPWRIGAAAAGEERGAQMDRSMRRTGRVFTCAQRQSLRPVLCTAVQYYWNTQAQVDIYLARHLG